jgi:ATP-dependent Clp protease ATP-binding subunit ClpA
VIGRDDEIRRIIRILSRKTKNNPVLIGDPGVGKTAIAEGLAHRIVRQEQQMLVREQELMDEIQRLRKQMAQDCNWQTR